MDRSTPLHPLRTEGVGGQEWKEEGAQNEGVQPLTEGKASLWSGAWSSPPYCCPLRHQLEGVTGILGAGVHCEGRRRVVFAAFGSFQHRAVALAGWRPDPRRIEVGTGKLRGQLPRSNCDGPGSWLSGAG